MKTKSLYFSIGLFLLIFIPIFWIGLNQIPRITVSAVISLAITSAATGGSAAFMLRLFLGIKNTPDGDLKVEENI